MLKPKGLNAEILFLCERRELAQFIGGYLRYLRQQGCELPAAQLLQCQSLEQLPRLLAALPEREGFSKVRWLIFLGDATNRLRQRLQDLACIEMRSFLKEYAGYRCYLFPGRRVTNHWELGYLEDLLLELLRPQKFGGCYYCSMRGIAASFIDTAEAQLAAPAFTEIASPYQAEFKEKLAPAYQAIPETESDIAAKAPCVNRSKKLLHALLAASGKYAGMNIADAMQADLFNLADARLQPLRDILLKAADNGEKRSCC